MINFCDPVSLAMKGRKWPVEGHMTHGGDPWGLELGAAPPIILKIKGPVTLVFHLKNMLIFL